ncbi:MAG: deoxycytidylate deaminase [Candidatus Muiribacteriota bacterium]
MRPDWKDYFMQISELVSTRSTCIRRKVGAVIVKNNRILTTGYNGVPSKLMHCDEIGCLRDKMSIPSGQRQELCRGLHAEQNGIIQAAANGIMIQDSILFCTHQPCITCAKMIINSGITKVYIKRSYPDELAAEILKEANVPVEVINIGN